MELTYTWEIFGTEHNLPAKESFRNFIDSMEFDGHTSTEKLLKLVNKRLKDYNCTYSITGNIPFSTIRTLKFASAEDAAAFVLRWN